MKQLPANTHVLNALGWDWHENGVHFSVAVDGQRFNVFVPLNRVWHEFNKEMAAVGCPFEPAIGGEVTVAGLFGSITKAIGKAASGATKAVAKAASSVAKTATSYASLAAKAYTAPFQLAGKVTGLSSLTNGLTTLMTGPLKVVDDLAKGGRIDKVALSNLKQQIAAARDVAPYAQAVIGVVPGVGQGLNAAIGAGLALAAGQSITEALAAGVRSSLPGGPLAAAAFDLSRAAMSGKPVSSALLASLPVSPAAKAALVRGLGAAQALAKGQKVSQVIVDQALASLPPEARKAVQIGAAIGHGQWAQAAGGAANMAGVKAPPGALAVAAKASTIYNRGLAAATAIRNGQATAENLARVRAGLATRDAMAIVAQRAQAGDQAARALAGAFTRVPRVGAPIGSSFKPRYHTSAAVGGLFNFSRLAQMRRGNVWHRAYGR